MERKRSISSGSVEVSPSLVLIAIGKKQNSVTTITFGAMPKPNQMISSGARAMIGTVCDMTSRG